MALYIQIPCTYKNNLLHIKALKLSGAGDTIELALAAAIKNTALYTSLNKAKFEYNKNNLALVAFFSDILMKEITRIEPYPEDKAKAKGFVTTPTAEELVQYGY